MTVDPIMDSEESSFELEDQSYTLPMGKEISLADVKSPMIALESDPFVESDMLELNPELGSLNLQYF
jgi:hypothetical protein